jgi:hypothetical protein
MPAKRSLGGLALLAGCQPAQQGNPASPAAGLTESQQRWRQIQDMQADPRTRILDPNPTVATGVSPQTFSITPPTGDAIRMR